MNNPAKNEGSTPETEPTLELPAGAAAEKSETLDISFERTGGSNRPLADGGAVPVTLPRIPGYEILQFVARGGMGMVYKAREVNLRRTVAIKVPRADYCDSPEDLQRFLAEAQSAAMLEHPNICPVYRVDEFEGRPFIAMGFVEGETLKAWCEARPPAPKEAATMVARLGRAVDFAHQRKVLHRDLKPSNVMIRRDGNEPVLMDFGLAKQMGEHQSQLTTTGAILGTPAFMAPEQAEGKTSSVGLAADIYSLGAILYDLICGRPPFVGSVAEVLLAVRSTEPVAPRRRKPTIPRDLETICLKALAKEPARRYASARELADDLELFVAGEPIRARREPLPSRMLRQVRRYPLATTLGAVLLVLLASVAAVVPSVLSARRKAQLLERIQQLVDEPKFAADELAQAEPLLTELATVAPEQLEGGKQRVHRRLAAAVQEMLRARQLSAADKQELAAIFDLLEARDKSLADPLRAQRDARFQGWNPLAELKPPFASLPEFSPPGTLETQGNVLVPPSGTPINHWGGFRVGLPAISGEDCRLDATFAGYAKSGGSLALALKTHGDAQGTLEVVRFSRDGNRIFAGGEGTIRVWDVVVGQELKSLEGHKGRLLTLETHPTLPLLLSSGDDGFIRVWDLAGKDLVRSVEFPGSTEPAAGWDRFPLAISADGQTLYAAWSRGEKDEISRWHLPDLQPLAALSGNGSSVFSLALSSDGNLLAAGTRRGTIQIWNLKAQKIERTIAAFEDPVRSLAFHPENHVLFSSTMVGVVRIFSADQGTQQGRLMGHEANIFDLVPERGGSRLVAAHGNGMRVWNLATQQMEPAYKDYIGHLHSVTVSPDGSQIAAGGLDGMIYIWDVASGREKMRLGSPGYECLVDTPPVTIAANQAAAPRQARLEIRRDGLLLAESTMTLPPDPLRLRASIEGGKVRFQLNNLPELNVAEFIPQSSEGGFAVQLPPGVALAELQLDERPLSTAAGPLEQADRLLAGRRYQEAVDLFQQQLGVLTASPQDALTRTEIQTKIAVCLLQLNQSDAAHDMFRQILARPSNDPYFLVAGVQLWLEVIRKGDFEESARVFHTLEPNFTPEQVERIVPMDQRQKIARVYAQFLLRNSAILQAGSQARLREGVEIARFLKTDFVTGVNFRLFLMASERMAGNDAEVAELAAEAVSLMEKPLTQFNDIPFERHHLGELQTFGYLCRHIGDPQRAIRQIDARIGKFPQLPSQKQHDAWFVLIERACLKVASQDIPAASQDVERYFTQVPPDAMNYDDHSAAWLLRGFLREAQGDAAGAVEAWKAASVEAYLKSHPSAKVETDSSSRRTVMISVIGSLADTLTEAQAADLIAIGGQVLPDTASKQILPLMLGNPRSTLAAMWRSKYAKEQARLIACRELLFPEQVRAFTVAAAAELLHQLCLPGELNDEHSELIWQTALAGLKEYSEGKLPILQLVPLMHRFRGNASLFSDSSLLAPLSDDLRPRAAYLLAHRLLSKNKDIAGARGCLEIAIRSSAEGTRIRKLAQEELVKLPPK